MNHNSSIKVIGSGSKGNCYVVQVGAEKLLLDGGIKFSKVLKQLNFNISDIKGALISHKHLDHSLALNDMLLHRLDIFTHEEVIKTFGLEDSRINEVQNLKQFKVGEFNIIPLKVKHLDTDMSECLNFSYVIHHRNIGKILFATDLANFNYRIKGLNYILIECNHSVEFLEDNFNKDRIMASHMSLEKLKKILSDTDLSKCREIILIHLSEKNSDEVLFATEIEKLTGIKTTIAKCGIEIRMEG